MYAVMMVMLMMLHEKSDGDVDDDGDGCGKVGFRIFDQYCRHLLGPGDDSVEDINMKWVTLE